MRGSFEVCAVVLLNEQSGLGELSVVQVVGVDEALARLLLDVAELAEQLASVRLVQRCGCRASRQRMRSFALGRGATRTHLVLVRQLIARCHEMDVLFAQMPELLAETLGLASESLVGLLHLAASVETLHFDNSFFFVYSFDLN